MIVYIMSPYTQGDKEANVRQQIDAAEELRAAEHLPIAPLLYHYWHAVHPHDWQWWLDMDLEWLAYADAAIRLPGDSKGADIEEEAAKKLRVPVYPGVAAFLTACETQTQEAVSATLYERVTRRILRAFNVALEDVARQVYGPQPLIWVGLHTIKQKALRAVDVVFSHPLSPL